MDDHDNLMLLSRSMRLGKEALARALSAAEITAEFDGTKGLFRSETAGAPLVRSITASGETAEALASSLEGELNQKLEPGKPLCWRHRASLDVRGGRVSVAMAFAQAPDVKTAREWCGLPIEETTDGR